MDAIEKTRIPFDQLEDSSSGAMQRLFSDLIALAQNEANSIGDDESCEAFRVRWLGRKDSIRDRIKENWLIKAPAHAKKLIGTHFNTFATVVEELHRYKKDAIGILDLDVDHVDLSLPGVQRPIGSRHLIRQTIEEIERIFLSLGYTVVEGPEIETPYYNFEALNIPEHHPVRDDMDTFYLELPEDAPTRLLRTHTSPVQIRTMEKQKPPVRIIVPGKVYRRDNPDATHSFMFHQVEGLAVDSDITFCDYKGTMEYFVRQFLGPSVKTRFRPSYFPFTEPSVEVDASCHVCGGGGCRVCKFSGWIELLGSGMVDPAVYGFVDYDQTKLNGFAFGMGVDRLALLKYGLNDLQVLFQNDVRFLRQFP